MEPPFCSEYSCKIGRPYDAAVARAIADLAYTALMDEVSAAPKPGLVCPGHNGSHTDMDYAVFAASAEALRPYFYETAAIGYAFHSEPHKPVMSSLRRAGLRAEQAMFSATGGVNTHKGLIFSLGLLTAACGRLIAEQTVTGANLAGPRTEGLTGTAVTAPEAVAAEAARFIPGLTQSELMPLRRQQPDRKLTAGETLFLEYGATGIRGEAESGFPSALTAYSELKQTVAEHSFALAVPHALLGLMAKVTDTNVLWRSGADGLAYVRGTARNALGLGGMFTQEGRAAVMRMHDEFPRRNISPGGSADLLVIAVFFWRWIVEIA